MRGKRKKRKKENSEGKTRADAYVRRKIAVVRRYRESPSRDGQISVGNGTVGLVTFRRYESVILTSKRQMWYIGSDRYRKAWNMQIAAGTGRDTAVCDLHLRGTSLRRTTRKITGARCGDSLGKRRLANIKKKEIFLRRG